jgi:hypothetical protein
MLSVTLVCLVSIPNIAAAEDGEDNLPRYWEIHAWLLTIGTGLFVLSYVALWLKYLSRIKGVEIPALATRISRKWYDLHVYLGAAGVLIGLAGVALGYYMVDQAHNGQHLRISHSYIGVISGSVVLGPLVTGFAARALKRSSYALRWWHIAIGLAGTIIMLAGLFTGWATE